METSLQSDLGTVYAATIQGARNQQQDAVRIRWLADEAAWLIVLADGMGGHAAGDLASKIAVDSFVGAFASMREGDAGLEESFRSALDDANARIAAVQSARPETKGMGTTLVAAHISGQGLRWVSVGDSLLMIYRDGAVAHLNEDHSLRSLSAEARGAAAANMLTSALSGGPIHKIDLHLDPLPVGVGDLLIVASDGVLSITDEQIAGVLSSTPVVEVDAMTEALIDSVNLAEKPHQDNCTIAMFSPSAERAATRFGLRVILGSLLILAALGAAAAFAVHRLYF
jgi:serine/threonine protein phosphatase PrpC